MRRALALAALSLALPALAACGTEDVAYAESDYDEPLDPTPQYYEPGPGDLHDEMLFDDTLEEYTEGGFEVEVTE